MERGRGNRGGLVIGALQCMASMVLNSDKIARDGFVPKTDTGIAKWRMQRGWRGWEKELVGRFYFGQRRRNVVVGTGILGGVCQNLDPVKK